MKLSPKKPLPRDEFRQCVFDRDNHKCVICGEPSKDAHHIMERRLFSDGGYYLNNGASLCSSCHIKAETTEISCEQIREAIGIKKAFLPEHLYADAVYTKWGDIILPNGMRAPGELFYDESVQKILKEGDKLNLYMKYIKYPRTFHVPWSGYMGEDDKISSSIDKLFQNEIVITEKLDGENTTMYNDYVHARSIDGNSHWTQSWIRNLQATIGHEIPKNWRICGENLYAKHSIGYKDLKSFFYIFSIWDEKNNCLSWDDTAEWAELLNIPTVPVLYKGIWNDVPEKIHSHIWEKKIDESSHEGYVIRNANSFNYSLFRENTAKYVRENHVTTSTHWKWDKIELNTLQTL